MSARTRHWTLSSTSSVQSELLAHVLCQGVSSGLFPCDFPTKIGLFPCDFPTKIVSLFPISPCMLHVPNSSNPLT